MSNGKPSVTLTGWKAVVVLVAVVAFTGFRIVTARASLDDMVVRVDLAPNAAFPSDFELVRFHRMRYSTLVGWSHRGNTNAVAWYLALV